MKWIDGFFGNKFHKRVFFICLFTSITLLIASFIIPPLGLIEPSVLAAVGEVFAFASLGEIGAAIDRGRKATISRGDIHLTVDGDDAKEEDNK